MKNAFPASRSLTILIIILIIGLITYLFSDKSADDILPNLKTTVTETDSDGDGMGDSFELAYTDPSSATALSPTADNDSDTFSNLHECRNRMNPLVSDTDSDSDGMPDIFELAYTNPSSPTSLVATGDPDGDTFSSLIEFQAGQNPIIYNVTLESDICDAI